MAALGTPSGRKLTKKIETLHNIPSPAQYWREQVSSRPMSRGLEATSDDPESRSWIRFPPPGWTGSDYVYSDAAAAQWESSSSPQRTSTIALPAVPATSEKRARLSSPPSQPPPKRRVAFAGMGESPNTGHPSYSRSCQEEARHIIASRYDDAP